MLNRLAYQSMKYRTASLVCIFSVLCIGMMKQIAEFGLPSDGFSWMANLSTDISIDQQPCSTDEDDDLSEDLDDAIIPGNGMKFSLWTVITQYVRGVCLPRLWPPLPKIPIAWYVVAYF